MAKSKNHSFTERILSETKAAVKNFGTYTFDDKGPEEVMNIRVLERDFTKLSHKAKVQVAQELKTKNSRANSVFSYLLSLVEKDQTSKKFQEILMAAHKDVKEEFDSVSYPGSVVQIIPAGNMFDVLGIKPRK